MSEATGFLIGMAATLLVATWALFYAVRGRAVPQVWLPIAIACFALCALCNPIVNTSLESWSQARRAASMREFVCEPVEVLQAVFGSPTGDIGARSGGRLVSYAAPWCFFYARQEVVVPLSTTGAVGFAHVGG